MIYYGYTNSIRHTVFYKGTQFMRTYIYNDDLKIHNQQFYTFSYEL